MYLCNFGVKPRGVSAPCIAFISHKIDFKNKNRFRDAKDTAARRNRLSAFSLLYIKIFRQSDIVLLYQKHIPIASKLHLEFELQTLSTDILCQPNQKYRSANQIVTFFEIEPYI